MLLASRNEPRKYYRAASANTKSIKHRPRSQSNSRGNRTAEITNFILNKQPNHNMTTPKNNLLPANTSELIQLGRQKRHSVKSTHKQVQQLFEQNICLKKQNNKLAEELTHLKGRIQAKSRRNIERQKQLDMEFEKQLYWTGSKTYLISGIKYQYKKLKKAYEEQLNEIEELKRQLRESKIEEYQIYIENIQIENRRLVQKIKNLEQKPSKIMDSNPRVTPKVYDLSYEQKYLKIQKQMEQMRKDKQHMKQILKQKQSKILFIEKLLIEKDNRDYHNGRKMRKLEKQSQQLKNVNNKFLDEINSIRKVHQYELGKMKKKYEEQRQELRQMQKKQLSDFRGKIECLIQDKRQLENTVIKLKKAATQPTGNRLQKRNTSSNSMNNSINRVQNSNQPLIKTITFGNSNSLNKNVQIPQTQSMQDQEQDYDEEFDRKNVNKVRVMQTADKKHSEHSKKSRKVQHSQITEIAQLIRYRMIAAGISEDGMKKYFDRPKKQQLAEFVMPQSQQKQGSPQPEWQDQYINMRQVIAILKAEPFNLDQTSTHMFARYAIQDCNEQYVYCDQDNENKRQIVKSIIKAAVGSYELPSQKQLASINDFQQKYLHNFYSALKTYYPSGKVTKKKFMEVLLSMGTDLNEKSQQILISKVVAKSANLSELQYETLNQI